MQPQQVDNINTSDFISKIKINNPEITDFEKSQLIELIVKNKNVFAENPKNPGFTGTTFHEINTADAKPVKSHPYRVNHHSEGIIKSEISNMLENNIIEPSNSPWSAPVVLVTKKDGSVRFCVDYRKLNAITVKDSYPLPRIDDTLDRLGKNKFFSAFDLASGYWQIPVKEEDKPKTAFTTKFGLYQFKVMSFGLTNAPSTFQRTMDVVLSGLTWKNCLVYLDDIIVYSPNFSQHLKDIQELFDAMKTASLKFKLEKCKFASNRINYLGHIVSNNGISVDPSKIDAVKHFPTPKNLTETRSFLGLCNYYRKFINDFANIAAPLTRLTRLNVKFKWDSYCEDAFKSLKEKLISAPILAYPDFTIPFHLCTDASDVGIGAILSQVINDKECVIAYASRTLNEHERNYSTCEKEALAVVWACQNFRHYLLGRKFQITTDHSALRWLLNKKDQSGILSRWNQKLSEFEYDITHKPGKSIPHVDSLSRMPINNINNSDFMKTFHEDQLKDQSLDIYRQQVIPLDKYTTSTKEAFIMENNILYRYFTPESTGRTIKTCKQLVTPSSQRNKILKTFHESVLAGHLGHAKTYWKVCDRFWWPGVRKDIQNWIDSCTTCQKKKKTNLKYGKLQPIPAPNQAFHTLGMDILGPLPATDAGNSYILVITDYLTKWAEAFPMKNQEATTIAKIFVNEIICRYGAPYKLITDRGKSFLNQILDAVNRIFEIDKLNTTSYHPQTDGLTERFNKTLAEMLSKYISNKQHDWDIYLPFCLFAYRTAIQKSIKESPFFLTYGREPKIPIDISLTPYELESIDIDDYRINLVNGLNEALKLAHDNIEIAQTSQVRSYDKSKSDTTFNPGDLVLLTNPAIGKGKSRKLSPAFKGPYIIKEKITDLLYKIQPHGKKQAKIETVNISRMKPFKSDTLRDDEEEPLEDDEYYVEQILAHRKRGRTTQYLVKWKDYPDSYNTWEKEENLDNCQEKLDQYLNKNTTRGRAVTQGGGNVENISPDISPDPVLNISLVTSRNIPENIPKDVTRIFRTN